MPKSILFICTANICRSPIAAALFNARFRSSTPNLQLQASSAGVSAIDGQPAHPLAQQVMSEYGGDLSTRRARTVTPDLLLRADMVFTMEAHHRRWILEKMPSLEHKVHLLGRWRDLEIVDPMGGTDLEFRETLQQIQASLDDWLPLLPVPATSATTTHASPITHHE